MLVLNMGISLGTSCKRTETKLILFEKQKYVPLYRDFPYNYRLFNSFTFFKSNNWSLSEKLSHFGLLRQLQELRSFVNIYRFFFFLACFPTKIFRLLFPLPPTIHPVRGNTAAAGGKGS